MQRNKELCSYTKCYKYNADKSHSFYWREIHADLKATCHFKGPDPS